MEHDPNPLVEQGHLLDFAHIKPCHVTEAVTTLIERSREALASATSPRTPADWNHTVAPLQDALEKLGRAWGAAGHLMGVMDSPQWREAVNANLPVITQFYIELSQDEALFARYKEIAASPGFSSMDPVRRRVIEREIRDFRLSGADLPEKEKAELKALGEREAALMQKFGENVLDATNAFHLDITDREKLAGIPDDSVSLYRADAESAGLEGWRISLQYPSYSAAMQYASDRSLRETMHRAYAVRASELDSAGRDNTPVIHELLAVRSREAELLGFRNYAEVSLATKMAESPRQVLDFLRQMAARAKPFAERDEAELEGFAREKLGLEKLEPWDLAWAGEKLRQARYNYSAQEVKKYFTLPKVFEGLFTLVENLFDIRIRPDTAPVWHPDVQFFRIEDGQGRLLAQFYTDLYARASKRGGAWMDNDLARRKMPDGSVRTPTAYLVCNFARPTDGKPALLTHRDVETLFHEFGHGLHHMLTQVDVPQCAGINGVEWDAVEMPSQFMENWTWQYEVVRSISSHVDTGESLPKELFDRMLAAKNFQSGLGCVRQLEFSLFDMLIHCGNEKQGKSFEQVLEDVRKEVAVAPAADYSRFPHSFGHIFAGGYAAGYYSYKWAEVLSADAFSAFEEEGIFNRQTGARWLSEILARGSSRDAIESFRAFRGRDPSIDALLRHSGMA